MAGNQGLYKKYRVDKIVHHTEPEVWTEHVPVTEPVFVLKPDTDPHARAALVAYADSARAAGLEQLALDLYCWLGEINTGE